MKNPLRLAPPVLGSCAMAVFAIGALAYLKIEALGSIMKPAPAPWFLLALILALLAGGAKALNLHLDRWTWNGGYCRSCQGAFLSLGESTSDGRRVYRCGCREHVSFEPGVDRRFE